MRLEQTEHTMHARMDAQTAAIRADALERVLAVLDEVPETLTVRELRPVIEETADKATIEMLRRYLYQGWHLS